MKGKSGLKQEVIYVPIFQIGFIILVDGLTPFLTNVEAVYDSSEELLKMIKKVDAYTSNLEKRVHEMF